MVLIATNYALSAMISVGGWTTLLSSSDSFKRRCQKEAAPGRSPTANLAVRSEKVF